MAPGEGDSNMWLHIGLESAPGPGGAAEEVTG